MAEEALALSPVPVGAASTADADYLAIRDVFMETERGRWFLAEYTRRNRNADTAMVLEAVARIEQNMAAAREEAAASQPSEDASGSALAALERARTAIQREFSEARFDPMLLPWRKSARIIREIVWGLREVGADPRICNILDGQVRTIEAACDEFPLADIRDRILAALDAAGPQDQVAAPAVAGNAVDTGNADRAADTAWIQAAGLQSGEIEAEPAAPEPAAAEAMAAEAPVIAPVLEAAPVAAAIAETAVVEALAMEASVTETTAIEITIADIALIKPGVAETEAEREIVALLPAEPPAPILASSDEPAPGVAIVAEDIAAPVTAPVAAAPETPQPAPAAAAASRSIMTASAAQPAPQPMAEPVASEAPVEAAEASLPPPDLAHTDLSHVEPAPEDTAPVATAEADKPESNLWADIESEIAPLPPFDPAHEASLGASLIAQGVVKRPSRERADLLAPIRRMSHAERIAFFS